MLEGLSVVESRAAFLFQSKGGNPPDRCQSAAISGVAVGPIQADIAQTALTRMAYIL